MAWCVTASASEPARQTGQLPPASAVEVEVRFFIGVEARPLRIQKQCLSLHRFTAATATPLLGHQPIMRCSVPTYSWFRRAASSRCSLQDNPDAIG